jgi:hypothetical protein
MGIVTFRWVDTAEPSPPPSPPPQEIKGIYKHFQMKNGGNIRTICILICLFVL